MTASVEVEGLSKWFGQKVAVSEVSLSIGPGVTGILGPNGAGKTTLLRVVTGLQKPSQGTVRVLGVDPRADRSVYDRVSMVPEDESVYPALTAREFVRLNARLSGVDDPGVVEEAIEVVGLTDSADRKLGGFSKGMRQRAKVAGALVVRPEVLVLDEPLNGADPVQRAHLIELFVRLGAEGTTVIVSSHVLAEVERMAQRVVAMVDGRLAAEGTVGALREAMSDKPRRIVVRADDARALASELMALDSVAGVHLRDGTVTIEASDAAGLARSIAGAAVSAGVRITSIDPADESLESVFRYLVEAS